MIYVFPNGGKLPFHDLPGSFAETALVKELIPHNDENYRTIARRESRGIEGFSFGGRATARQRKSRSVSGSARATFGCCDTEPWRDFINASRAKANHDLPHVGRMGRLGAG